MKPKKLAASLSIFLLTCAVMLSPARALNMYFDDASSAYSSNDIWITIQRNTAATNPVTSDYVPDITYGGGNSVIWEDATNTVPQYSTMTNYLTNSGIITTNITTETNYLTNIGSVYSDPIKLSDIGSSGLNWISNAPSVAVVVSYGAPIPVSSYATATIAPASTADASYNIPYQNFEITYVPNPTDQGDVTAINYFTAPIGITSYASPNATGTPLQKPVGYAGYNAAYSRGIYNQLSAISGGSTAAVQFLTNGAGVTNTSAPLRVLGPTSFGTMTVGAVNDNGPYSNFNGYFSNMVSSSNQTILGNTSAYNTVPTISTGVAYNNMQVTFLMTNTVQSLANGYQLSAVGNITAVVTYYNAAHTATNIMTNTYYNVTFTVNPTAGNLTNVASAFVYGGSASQYPANAMMGGSGWTEFEAAASGYVTSGDSPVGAAVNVGSQIPGELAAAFAFGFAGSTNTVDQYGASELGSLVSSNWWALTNPVAFSQIQTNSNNYDQYGNVIFTATTNSVYGYAYSDRFIYAPNLINSDIYNGTNVGSWNVTLGDPILVPEPSYSVAILLFLTGFVCFRGLNQRSLKSKRKLE